MNKKKNYEQQVNIGAKHIKAHRNHLNWECSKLFVTWSCQKLSKQCSSLTMQSKTLSLSKHTKSTQCTLDCSSCITEMKMFKTSCHLKFSKAPESAIFRQWFKGKTHSFSKHTSTHWIVQVRLQKHTHWCSLFTLCTQHSHVIKKTSALTLPSLSLKIDHCIVASFNLNPNPKRTFYI